MCVCVCVRKFCRIAQRHQCDADDGVCVHHYIHVVRHLRAGAQSEVLKSSRAIRTRSGACSLANTHTNTLNDHLHRPTVSIFIIYCQLCSAVRAGGRINVVRVLGLRGVCTRNPAASVDRRRRRVRIVYGSGDAFE